MNTVVLTPLDLGLAAVLLLALAACTLVRRLDVAGDLVIAAARMTIQLLLVGLVLRALFDNATAIWIALAAVVMLLAAAREITARQERRMVGWRGFGIGGASMFLSSFVVAIFGLVAIIQEDPWYTPRYAIPILGMLLGNTMNGIAIALDRLTQTLWKQRSIVEQRLMLGQTRAGATQDIARESLRGGMIPIINGMAVAGIVSLPGMMTGQILAGASPVDAVRYQILIWLLIAAGAGFGMLLAVALTSRYLFDERDRLRLDRLR